MTLYHVSSRLEHGSLWSHYYRTKIQAVEAIIAAIGAGDLYVHYKVIETDAPDLDAGSIEQEVE